MDKVIRFPDGLLNDCKPTAALLLDGASAIEQCIITAGQQGTFFLQQHLLYVVLGGKVELRTGHQKVTLQRNEMVLLRKYSSVEFTKSRVGSEVFKSLLFAIRDDFLREFLSKQSTALPQREDSVDARLSAITMSDQLVAYCQSLEPYFKAPDHVPAGLLRLKMMELLYGVADSSQAILGQMMLLDSPSKADIQRVVEEHYATPVTVEQLAWLSGRSLSTFKRDFQALYHEAPARWVRERKLQEAASLLRKTELSVTDICYRLGFESLAAFSNAFRHRFGVSPSQIRATAQP